MMDEANVKEYFSKRDTVYLWWDPEISDKKGIYKRQERIVKDIFEKYNIKKILDVSAGKGRYAKTLVKGRDYTCLDISRQMLNCIKKYKLLGVKLVNADAENIPLKEKFEGILCSESLVHYPNPIKALKEMRRLLSDNGIIIITTDNKYCIGKIIRLIENFIRQLLHKRIKKGISNEIYQPYSNKEYKDMFKRADLRVEKKINLSILTTPIKIYSIDKYLLSPSVCRYFLFIDIVLEKIPLIKDLSTYFVYILKK